MHLRKALEQGRRGRSPSTNSPKAGRIRPIHAASRTRPTFYRMTQEVFANMARRRAYPTMSARLRVALADDHSVVRTGYRPAGAGSRHGGRRRFRRCGFRLPVVRHPFGRRAGARSVDAGAGRALALGQDAPARTEGVDLLHARQASMVGQALRAGADGYLTKSSSRMP
jgi:hypothetical protein